MKRLLIGLLFILLLVIPIQVSACSMAGCLNYGIETRPSFVVRITLDGKPLTGVTVQITAFGDGNATAHFSAITGKDGIARVTGLLPGHYWLNTDLLGISAGMECFHVGLHSSWRAKQKVNFDWGDSAPATTQIAGKLIDSQPSRGDSAIWNLTHRVDVPISGAKLKLQDPITGKTYSVVSNDDGSFAFGFKPQGIYVLHIDSGTAPGKREYDSTDLLLRLSDKASQHSLLMKRREAGGGSCGGTYLELQSSSN